MSENFSQIHENNLLTQAIKQKDLDELREKTKIGDIIKVHSYKMPSEKNASQLTYGEDKFGKVVFKAPYHAVLMFRHGLCESFTWVDLYMEQNKRGDTDYENNN